MGVVVVPLLAWGVMVTDSTLLRRRRTLALAVSVALLVVSGSRSGIMAGIVATAFLLVSLKRYRLFIRAIAVGVSALALVGLWSPDLIWKSGETVSSELIYKGHREGGLFASRKQPWDATMATIQAHPFFGSGFGAPMEINWSGVGSAQQYQGSLRNGTAGWDCAATLIGGAESPAAE